MTKREWTFWCEIELVAAFATVRAVYNPPRGLVNLLSANSQIHKRDK
jgi:hypothetical protein